MDRLESLKNQLSQITISFAAKTIVPNVSQIEAKVQEATNEDPWGASSTLMQEIANRTFNYPDFNKIMPVIYSRYMEKEARHGQALQLLEYLIKHGSERVVDDAQPHVSTFWRRESATPHHHVDGRVLRKGALHYCFDTFIIGTINYTIPSGHTSPEFIYVLFWGVENSSKNGLPDRVAVSATQGKFLHLLAKSIGAKTIVEVGTLGGYSTTWSAPALPDDGELVTLELEDKHAKVAEEYASKVKVVVGPARSSMKELPATPKFDLAFVDADKESSVEYFEEAKRVIRSRGIIVVDNVVRNGKVSDLEYDDPSSEGVRRLVNAIRNDAEVDATVIGTVGASIALPLPSSRQPRLHRLTLGIGYERRPAHSQHALSAERFPLMGHISSAGYSVAREKMLNHCSVRLPG
ncbi:S-adenosyl-L-methionine-dependent methyltransferase [Hymenopellis radicata]|nr:S-adenosyl-L-methionine-dependent methyltransferase [Hymenopellis radicata]